MATINKHCDDCKDVLGKEYKNIHIWLDCYARIFPIKIYSDYHRSFRHNSYGIECAKKLFGKTASEAVKIHLVRDMDDILPRDFDIWDYKNVIDKMLLYFNDMNNMEPFLYKSFLKNKIGIVAAANQYDNLTGKEGPW